MGFRASRVYGFRVYGSRGFRLEGSGLTVQGFRVEGLGLFLVLRGLGLLGFMGFRV